MSIGVCYFPEHWPEERWDTDIEMMADAGIEVVRMGEFAWSRFEPTPGEIHDAWLASVLDLIDDHGMDAVLCTPTATPPKWLVEAHPDILQEEADGTVREYGGRRHYCFNSETYREETERIVSTLASRFADHPAVIGWQTDNEYGCHGTLRCYCEDCAEAFRDWLRSRYDTIDTLNETWGTAFWSQHLRSFDEIDPPRHTAADHHPSRILDYHRFSSDAVVAYNRLQADLLREANEEWFVTHNFMYDFPSLNPFDVGVDLDMAAWDSYPTGFVQVSGSEEPSEDALRVGDPDGIGFNHDLYRCAAEGAFWVMEQQPGDINWPPLSTQPAEGAMRLWAHHAVAHGAEVVSFFRWRRCRHGQEQYHAGLLERDGSADRGYYDASQAADELSDLSIGEEPSGQVALVIDYESQWALGEQPMSPTFDYWGDLHSQYRALRRRGLTVDVVPPETDLSPYAAVIAPHIHLADRSLAERFESAVDAGTALLLTSRSGEKTPGNQLHPARPPGPFAELVGATVDDHESVAPALTVQVEYGGETYGCETWAEWLDTDAAAVRARYVSGPSAGQPAVTHRALGDGSVTYLGTGATDRLLDVVVGDVLEDASLPAEVLPDRVRIAQRGELTWVFNFSAEPISIASEVSPVLGYRSIDGYDLAVFDAPVAPRDIGA